MAAALRFEDWPRRLEEYITSVRDTPFAWGVNDCGLFAANCILALTGFDPAVHLRGKYDSEASAASVMGAGGILEFADTLAARHGFAEQAPAFARRGDVVLFDFGDKLTLGICVGLHVAGPGQRGLLMVRRSRATHSWRID